MYKIIYLKRSRELRAEPTLATRPVKFTPGPSPAGRLTFLTGMPHEVLVLWLKNWGQWENNRKELRGWTNAKVLLQFNNHMPVCLPCTRNPVPVGDTD